MSTRASSTDPGSKSAAEIEGEVQQSRAEIEHTLDAIQERLSPGQMVDQALGYFRGGRGVDFARNLGDSIAANPIPVALVGLGVAWMMFSSQRSTRDDDRRGAGYWEDDLDAVEEHYAGFAEEEQYTGFAEADLGYLGPEAETGEGFGAHLKEAGQSVKSKMAGLGERARDAGERVRHAGERARSASEHARDRFGRARAGVAERAHEAGERVRHHGYRAKQGMLRTLDEQPLVLGAIGLAIGAALGAALPPTRTEDEVMGETRDEVLRRATRAGREQAAKVREAASAVAAAAREEAGKQGLTPERWSKPDPAVRARSAAAPETPLAGFTDAPHPADPKASSDRP
jgi:ElaB/YqjD/DUF883 family membrane-anchored ribosome-binding protein